MPDSPGVPAALAALTLTVPFNDLDAVRALQAQRGDAGRRGHRGAGGRQHGRGAARAGLPGGPARAARAARRAADLRRGDHRLPRRPTAAPRRATACGPTSRAWARSSAAACRSAPTAAAATSWSEVAPLGPRLPGGHALGQSARGRRRPRRARARSPTAGAYERLEALGRAARATGSRDGARRRRRAAHGQPRGLDAHRVLLPRPGGRLRLAPRARRHGPLRALLPGACSSGACTWPPSQFEAAFVSLAHSEADLDAAGARRRRRSRPSREVSCR